MQYIRLTREILEELVDCRSRGYTTEQACAVVGVPKTILAKWFIGLSERGSLNAELRERFQSAFEDFEREQMKASA